MVKPSQPLMARLRLTTKQVGGGYYKGTRSGSMGYFAKDGSYVIDWKKVRTYVVPEQLANFKLTPFVTKTMPPTKSEYLQYNKKKGKDTDRGFHGRDYLQLWAENNGPEVIECQNLEQKFTAKGSIAEPKRRNQAQNQR